LQSFLQPIDRSRQLTDFIVPIDVGGGVQISLIHTIRYRFEFGEWAADTASN
jgi:hypothetical protein